MPIKWMIEKLNDGYLQVRESGPLNEGASLVEEFDTADAAHAAREEMYDPGAVKRTAFNERVSAEARAVVYDARRLADDAYYNRVHRNWPPMRPFRPRKS